MKTIMVLLALLALLAASCALAGPSLTAATATNTTMSALAAVPSSVPFGFVEGRTEEGCTEGRAVVAPKTPTAAAGDVGSAVVLTACAVAATYPEAKLGSAGTPANTVTALTLRDLKAAGATRTATTLKASVEQLGAAPPEGVSHNLTVAVGFVRAC